MIGVADLFFYDHWPAATIGVFGLAWTVILTIVRPDARRHRPARVALIVAGGFALILIDDPSIVSWSLFWAAMASATLLPRHRFTDAIEWGGRLLGHAILGIPTPLRDLHRLALSRHRRKQTSLGAVLALIALPVLGSSIFLALFASANPLVANAFAAIRLPDLSSVIAHLALWITALLAIWPNLRPRNTMLPIGGGAEGAVLLVPTIPLATLTLSLFTFNAIFAVQNGLDLAFLWSGAALPTGVTMADYAHRGAYPLIVTALLAGAFALVASRPDGGASRSATVRALLVVWIAQNVLLVASSALRTIDYIDAYSLTRLRIAALAWMASVAIGLVLIAWRMVAGRSARWLINANAVAAGVMLAAASLVDLGAVAAAWNVRHARTADALDLCYLHNLGPSALLPLIELERRAAGPRLRDRTVFVRSQIMADLIQRQADWRSWTGRDARRLSAAHRLLGHLPPQPRTVPNGRDCDGEPYAPPPPVTLQIPTPRFTPTPTATSSSLTNAARP
jgi:hypothetical protein